MSEKSKSLYLISIEGWNQPKNKYQKSVIDLVKNFNRMLVENPEAVIHQLNCRIQLMHKSFAKCKPVNTHVKYPSGGEINRDIYYFISDFMSFRFLEIKGKFQDDVLQPFIEFGEQLTTAKQETIV